MASHLLAFGGVKLDVVDPALDLKPIGEAYLALLRAFLADCASSCTFYRQRLEKAKVSPEQVRSFDDFRRVPMLSSVTVSSIAPFSLLPDRYRAALAAGSLESMPEAERLAKTFRTSSTTGTPKISYYTRDDWDANCAMISRHHRHLPIQKYSRALNCFTAGHFGGKNVEDSFNRQGCVVENRHFTFNTAQEVLGQLTKGLAELGGYNCLAVPPWRPGAGPAKGVSLDELLDADDENFIGSRIQVLIVGGAPTDLPEHRLRERVWEANALAGRKDRTVFVEKYGGAEVGLGAVSCEQGELHLLPGPIYTEVIDEKTGAAVADGGRGLVVFTGLRQGSRFVRYVIGDEATYVSTPCKCGRATARLQTVRRVTDLDRLTSGCAAGGL